MPAVDLDIVRAQSGDRRALRGLIDAHGPLVWSLARRLAAEPEDAYQEIWEKVFRALPRFDPAGRASFRTWLATVANRHLIDRHRRAVVRRVEPLRAEPAHEPDPSAEIDSKRSEARLEALLRLLPEPQRRAVVMHHVHGLDLAEIAAIEGVARGTIKSRLHRGRGRLAELLETRP